MTTAPAVELDIRPATRPALKRAHFLLVSSQAILDIAMIWLAFYLAYLMRGLTPDAEVGPFLDFVPLGAVYTGTVWLVFAFRHMYRHWRSPSRLDELYAVIRTVTLGSLLTIAVVSFFFKGQIEYHRLMMVYAWALTIAFVTAGRLVHGHLRGSLQAAGIGEDRVMLVGTGEAGRMILQRILTNPRLGYRVVGVIDVGQGPRSILGVPVLGRPADIPRIIEEHEVDEVIIGLPQASHEELLNLISLCEREKVGIRVFPDVFQFMASGVSIDDLSGLPLITIRDVAMRGWKLAVKRMIDIVVSALALILLSPIMLLTAILIKLESPGPVFYVQERMGLDAKPFPMLKFRSMSTDAEANGPGWTTKDDPRRTVIGTWLRRLSVDELPQLINILVGDMSLVGPRPERPVYVEQFRQSIPRYMERHREKAGLTGWAQVNGLRGDTSIDERTKYDLWYIENWSLTLDIKILIRTLFQIFTDRNAY